MANSIALLRSRPTSVGTYRSSNVPAGRGCLITSVILTKRGAGSAVLSWGITVGGVDYNLRSVTLTGLGATEQTRPWVFLAAGESVWVDQDTASSMVAVITGLEFDT